MKITNAITATLVVLCLAGAAYANPPHCTKGQLCGDTCISKNDVCHVPPAAQDAKKHCNKGKPCGNSCIAKDKVCHK